MSTTGTLAGLSPEELQQLHQRLRSARRRAPKPGAMDRAPIPQRSSGEPVPLSYAQQRLWFIHQLDASSAAYHIPAAVELEGELSSEALFRALAWVTERHEGLRTVMAPAEGRAPAGPEASADLQPESVLQRVLPPPRDLLPVIDLSALPSEPAKAEALRLESAEGLRPFDLATGPLVRWHLLRLTPVAHRLLLTLHHISADNWSMVVLLRELNHAYDCFRQGQAPQLPSLSLQYADFAVWQRRWLAGEAMEEQLSWWREQLEGMPPVLELPADRPRPAMPSFTFSRHEGRLSPQLTAALRDLAQATGTTLYMVLLAGYFALLHRWTGRSDLVTGTPVANRRRRELEGLVGFFANTLLMRQRLTSAQSFEALLEAVKQTCLGAYGHQDLPFERLVEALAPARDNTFQPLFQVMFNLFDGELPELRLEGLKAAEVAVRIGTMNDLDLLLVDRGAHLETYWRTNDDLFDAATVESIAAAFEELLESVVAQPSIGLGELPLQPTLAALRLTALRRRRADRAARTVAVVASFTAEPVEEALSFWLETLGLDARLELAPYHQVLQQLLDPSSLLATAGGGGAAVALVRLEDWFRYRSPDESHSQASHSQAPQPGTLAASAVASAEKVAEELLAAARGWSERPGTPPLLLLFCPSSETPSAEGMATEMATVQSALVAQLRALPGVEALGSEDLLTAYELPQLYDPEADRLGHVPYRDEGYAALATIIARSLWQRWSPPVKVVAVDCDHTLWGGVVAEDGVAALALDGVFADLQRRLVALQESGVLICLLSKNREQDVWEVFDQRQDMILRREHIAAWGIDWRPKSENLRRLAEDLGLGLDSFVFLDDNPVEVSEVRSRLPEVISLHLPEAEERAGMMPHLWPLDGRGATREDRERTELYRREAQRQRSRREAGGSFAEFLAGLNLEVALTVPGAEQFPRVAQLTQRTNQFNASAVRRDEAAVAAFLAAGGEARIASVKDRFGDYGVVGLVLTEERGEALRVDTFLLSCRVLGRGVEHRVLADLGRRALETGLRKLEIPFEPAPRNQPMSDFLATLDHPADPREARVVTVSAEAAAALSYQPEEPAEFEAQNEAEEKVQEELGAVSTESATDRGTLLLQVATEWASPAAVLKAASARRQLGTGPRRAPFVAPRTPDEETLVAIFEELLEVPNIGIRDDFFRLGGHSLLATRLASRLREAFDIDWPLQAYFEAPTIEGLAQRIHQEQITAADQANLEALLESISGMSDEEVLASLEGGVSQE